MAAHGPFIFQKGTPVYRISFTTTIPAFAPTPTPPASTTPAATPSVPSAPPAPPLPGPSKWLLDTIGTVTDWCLQRPWLALVAVLLAGSGYAARTIVPGR